MTTEPSRLANTITRRDTVIGYMVIYRGIMSIEIDLDPYFDNLPIVTGQANVTAVAQAGPPKNLIITPADSTTTSAEYDNVLLTDGENEKRLTLDVRPKPLSPGSTTLHSLDAFRDFIEVPPGATLKYPLDVFDWSAEFDTIDDYNDLTFSIAITPIRQPASYLSTPGTGTIIVLNASLTGTTPTLEIESVNAGRGEIEIICTESATSTEIGRVTKEISVRDIAVSYTHLTLPTKRIV